MALRAAFGASLLTTIAPCMAAVPSDLIPIRARGGRLYKDAIRAENAATLAVGGKALARNSTVNIWNNQVIPGDGAGGTFAQRYWVDWSNWKAGSTGPIFLYISGEGPASSSPGGAAQAFGAEMGALLITLEHRFYGESLPAPLTDTATLKASLTVDNVMADLANFTAFFENTWLPALPSGQKYTWVSVGGSYAGALSSWVRQKHPEVFDASWSSSGVVDAVFNFTAFDLQIVKDVPSACSAALRGAMAAAEAAWADPKARAAMLAAWGTPTYFTQQDFLWMLADSSAMGPQYGYKELLCEYMTGPSASTTPLDRLRNWTVAHYGAAFPSSCYYSTVALSDPKYADQWAGCSYAWVYQTCSELAYWQVWSAGAYRSQLIDLDYYTTQCRIAFGSDVFANTTAFNARYGGANPKSTKTVALQGSDDPWQGAGVQQTLSPLYPEHTAVCDGCGHCGDLATPSADADPAITAQQAFIKATLTGWLGQ